MAYICKFDRHNRSGETKRVRLSGESYQSISSNFAQWDNSIQKDEEDYEIKLHSCCVTSNYKCEVGLMVMRAALRCPKHPKSLSILLKNAIQWSKTNEVKRSESNAIVFTFALFLKMIQQRKQ